MAGPIRQQFDLKRLDSYIKDNVPEIQLPIEVKQFGYGQSNPTYLLAARDGSKYVMRKKPPGKLLSKTAHQVDREYRIIHALEKTDVPVPRAICLCQDTSIIGTDFYIMSFLNGRIFEDPAMPGVSAEDRTAMWKSAVTTLAKFHRVKPASVGMESFGKPNNFFNRQLKTFSTLSKAQAATKDVETGKPVGNIPFYDEMSTFFQQADTQPKDKGTFVHGDYKIDNMVFHATEPYVIGVLDWEMATIGHPWSDLSNFFMNFTSATREKAKKVGRAHAGFAPGSVPGLPTKEQLVRWYEETSGLTVPPKELTWAEAFNTWRGAIIMQGIAARYAVRQASSPNAKTYGEMMGPFAEMAYDLVQECRSQSSSKL